MVSGRRAPPTIDLRKYAGGLLTSTLPIQQPANCSGGGIHCQTLQLAPAAQQSCRHVATSVALVAVRCNPR